MDVDDDEDEEGGIVGAINIRKIEDEPSEDDEGDENMEVRRVHRYRIYMTLALERKVPFEMSRRGSAVLDDKGSIAKIKETRIRLVYRRVRVSCRVLSTALSYAVFGSV